MGSSCSLFALSELIRLIATPQSLAWHLHIASSPSSSSSESKSRRRKPPLTNPQRRAGSARPAPVILLLHVVVLRSQIPVPTPLSRDREHGKRKNLHPKILPNNTHLSEKKIL